MFKNSTHFIDAECVRHCSRTPFIFTKLLRGEYYCSYFTDEETMAERFIICSKSDTQVVKLRSKPRGLGLGAKEMI